MILALVAVFALATMSVQAQDNERPGMPDQKEMVKGMTKMMTETLGLNEEQKSAVEALNEKYAETMRPMRPMPPRGEGQEGDEEGKKSFKEKMKEAPKNFENKVKDETDKVKGDIDKKEERKEYKEALKAILTEEQFSKWEEMEKNMKRPHNPRQQIPQGQNGEGVGPQSPAPESGSCGAPCPKALKCCECTGTCPEACGDTCDCKKGCK